MRQRPRFWLGRGRLAVGFRVSASSAVASQVGLHERYGGVVPEIAARAHVRQLLPMIDEALRRASVALRDIEAVAVATRPGLVGALVVGLTAAKALALALDIPLWQSIIWRAISTLASSPTQIGRSIPASVWWSRAVTPACTFATTRCGASFWAERPTMPPARHSTRSRTCSSLGYPGGPAIERVAQGGDPSAFVLPRSFLHDPRLLLSFSGLKTAVLYALRGQNARDEIPELEPKLVSDLAASFQEAVFDVIIAKTRQAVVQHGNQADRRGRRRGRQFAVSRAAGRAGRRAGRRALHPAPCPLYRQRGDGRDRSPQAGGRANCRSRYRRHGRSGPARSRRLRRRLSLYRHARSRRPAGTEIRIGLVASPNPCETPAAAVEHVTPLERTGHRLGNVPCPVPRRTFRQAGIHLAHRISSQMNVRDHRPGTTTYSIPFDQAILLL